MRIRQIKPSFWSDSAVADLSEPSRLFYIGLWMIADDAGWFRWDGREVAKDLYGYEGVRRRESRVERMLAELVAAKRVIQYSCGHIEVPKLSQHQHLAGATKQVKTAFNDHLRYCHPTVPGEVPPTPAEPREAPPRLGKDVVSEGSVKERSGQSNGRASAKEEPTEFDRLVGPVSALDRLTA